MPYTLEDNRRSGIILTMHHKHNWFIDLWAEGVNKGDQHPAYTPIWGMVPLLCNKYRPAWEKCHRIWVREYIMQVNQGRVGKIRIMGKQQKE